jgi:plasmid stabilization system protein ParE
MQRITFHEEADRELSEAASYCEDRAPDLGLAFIDEIEKVLQRILERPMAYQSIGDEIRRRLNVSLTWRFMWLSPMNAYVSSRWPTKSVDQDTGEAAYGWTHDGRH